MLCDVVGYTCWGFCLCVQDVNSVHRKTDKRKVNPKQIYEAYPLAVVKYIRTHACKGFIQVVNMGISFWKSSRFAKYSYAL